MNTTSPPADTKLPELLGLFMISVSALIMAFSSLFEVILILIFLMMWIPFAVLKVRTVLKPAGEAFLLLSLPVLCCISALWADHFGKTLYHALQFGAMIACTLTFARLVSKEALIKGLSLGILGVLLITLASQNYATDYFTGRTILVGYFGSKNIAGFFASAGCLIGFLAFFLNAGFLTRLIYALPTFIVSLASLWMSYSASSIIATTAMFAALLALFTLSKLPGNSRWVGLGLMGFGGVTLIITAFAFELNVTENILSSLNRDTTLTGRTFLWQQGIEQIKDNPWLGHGYRDFWSPGNNEAEYLWEVFGITGKSGFHFHNFFIQAGVDLGLAGILLTSIILIASVFYACFYTLRYGMNLEIALLSSLSVMFLIRTIVEVDMLGPFGMGSFLFYMILPRALDYGRARTRFLNSEASCAAR